jgi:hypothetical protein
LSGIEAFNRSLDLPEDLLRCLQPSHGFSDRDKRDDI